MRLNFLGGILAVLLVAALIIGYSSLFTVYQTQQALVIRLGQPVRVVNEPGLNVKAPFIDSVARARGKDPQVARGTPRRDRRGVGCIAADRAPPATRPSAQA